MFQFALLAGCHHGDALLAHGSVKFESLAQISTRATAPTATHLRRSEGVWLPAVRGAGRRLCRAPAPRIGSVVDDWFVMTEDEKNLIIQMIFAEIRADHTSDGLNVEFRARAAWEPYIEAVLATQRQAPNDLTPTVTTSVARRGFEPLTSSLKGKRPGPLGDRAGL